MKTRPATPPPPQMVGDKIWAAVEMEQVPLPSLRLITGEVLSRDFHPLKSLQMIHDV